MTQIFYSLSPRYCYFGTNVVHKKKDAPNNVQAFSCLMLGYVLCFIKAQSSQSVATLVPMSTTCWLYQTISRVSLWQPDPSLLFCVSAATNPAPAFTLQGPLVIRVQWVPHLSCFSKLWDLSPKLLQSLFLLQIFKKKKNNERHK